MYNDLIPPLLSKPEIQFLILCASFFELSITSTVVTGRDLSPIFLTQGAHEEPNNRTFNSDDQRAN